MPARGGVLAFLCAALTLTPATSEATFTRVCGDTPFPEGGPFVGGYSLGHVSGEPAIAFYGRYPGDSRWAAVGMRAAGTARAGVHDFDIMGMARGGEATDYNAPASPSGVPVTASRTRTRVTLSTGAEFAVYRLLDGGAGMSLGNDMDVEVALAVGRGRIRDGGSHTPLPSGRAVITIRIMFCAPLRRALNLRPLTYKDSPDYKASPLAYINSAEFQTTPAYDVSPMYLATPAYKDTPRYRASPAAYVASPNYKVTPEHIASPERLATPKYKDSPEYDVSPMFLESPQAKEPTTPEPVGTAPELEAAPVAPTTTQMTTPTTVPSPTGMITTTDAATVTRMGDATDGVANATTTEAGGSGNGINDTGGSLPQETDRPTTPVPMTYVPPERVTRPPLSTQRVSDTVGSTMCFTPVNISGAGQCENATSSAAAPAYCRITDEFHAGLENALRTLLGGSAPAAGGPRSAVDVTEDCRWDAAMSCAAGCVLSVYDVTDDEAERLDDCSIGPSACPPLERLGLQVKRPPTTGAPATDAPPFKTTPLRQPVGTCWAMRRGDCNATADAHCDLNVDALEEMFAAVATDLGVVADDVTTYLTRCHMGTPVCPDKGTCELAMEVPGAVRGKLEACTAAPTQCSAMFSRGLRTAATPTAPTPAPPPEANLTVALIAGIILLLLLLSVCVLLYIKARRKRQAKAAAQRLADRSSPAQTRPSTASSPTSPPPPPPDSPLQQTVGRGATFASSQYEEYDVSQGTLGYTHGLSTPLAGPNGNGSGWFGHVDLNRSLPATMPRGHLGGSLGSSRGAPPRITSPHARVRSPQLPPNMLPRTTALDSLRSDGFGSVEGTMLPPLQSLGRGRGRTAPPRSYRPVR